MWHHLRLSCQHYSDDGKQSLWCTLWIQCCHFVKCNLMHMRIVVLIILDVKIISAIIVLEEDIHLTTTLLALNYKDLFFCFSLANGS